MGHFLDCRLNDEINHQLLNLTPHQHSLSLIFLHAQAALGPHLSPLRHIFILDPDVSFAEGSALKSIYLNLKTTAVKHFCHFAKVLVDATHSEMREVRRVKNNRSSYLESQHVVVAIEGSLAEPPLRLNKRLANGNNSPSASAICSGVNCDGS